MNINDQTPEQVIRKAVNIISLFGQSTKGINITTLEKAIQATIDVGGDFNEIEISYYYKSILTVDEFLGQISNESFIQVKY